MNLVDGHVAKFTQFTDTPLCTTETQVIQLYYRNQMTFNARVDENKRKDQVRKHLAPVSEGSVIKFRIYYIIRQNAF